jgi:hypothetical protein
MNGMTRMTRAARPPLDTPAVAPRRLRFIASRQVIDRNGRICDLEHLDLTTLNDRQLHDEHRSRANYGGPIGDVTSLRIITLDGVLALTGEATLRSTAAASAAVRKIAAASARGERRGVSLEWEIHHGTGRSYLETIALVDEPAVPGAGVTACWIDAPVTRRVASAARPKSLNETLKELDAAIRAAFAK